MTLGVETIQLQKDKGFQQKTVATHAGLDQSNYNKEENGKREPFAEVLQKLSLILSVSLDQLLNADDKKPPTAITLKDKTVLEKIRLLEQL